MYQCTRERQESFDPPCEIAIAISRRADPRDLYLIPSSLLISRCIVKSKTLDGATGCAKPRICASSAKYSLISSSLGIPVPVKAGFEAR